MSEIDSLERNEISSIEDEDQRDFRNIILIFSCLLFGILTTVFIGNTYGDYIPIIFVGFMGWRKTLSREKRSYYGLCRLFLYMFFISLWIVFIFKLIIGSILFLLNIKDLPIEKVQHLFPYALIVISYARTKHDMELNDKRRYLIHLLYDIPAFLLVLIFKLFNHPLNSLCSEITPHCCLGCLPISSDVDKLNEVGIKAVVNMCAEYKGPRRTYEKYHIKQIHLPTVEGTAPSLTTIQKAIQFMKESMNNHEKIFVHCKAGMGRSATVVFCHLVANENMTPENAIRLMKEKRPEIASSLVHYKPVKHFLASLKQQQQISKT